MAVLVRVRFAVLSSKSLTEINKNNQRKIAVNFLSMIFSRCFGCSKEPSHRNGSLEYFNICFG